MVEARGVAAYKKKNGTIAISDDQKQVVWTSDAAEPSVSINVAEITSRSNSVTRGSRNPQMLT